MTKAGLGLFCHNLEETRRSNYCLPGFCGDFTDATGSGGGLGGARIRRTRRPLGTSGVGQPLSEELSQSTGLSEKGRLWGLGEMRLKSRGEVLLRGRESGYTRPAPQWVGEGRGSSPLTAGRRPCGLVNWTEQLDKDVGAGPLLSICPSPTVAFEPWGIWKYSQSGQPPPNVTPRSSWSLGTRTGPGCSVLGEAGLESLQTKKNQPIAGERLRQRDRHMQQIHRTEKFRGLEA